MCRFHGENKAVVAATEARMKAATARREFDRLRGSRFAEFAPPADMDPVSALLDVYWSTVTTVYWLEAKVASPEHVDMWGSETGPRLSPYVEWLRGEKAEMRQQAGTLHRMGIAEREMRLAESQAEKLVPVVAHLLDGLNLTAEQQGRVKGLLVEMREQLRALTTGGEDRP